MRVSAREHYEMVAVAAYFLAEHRGFDPGRENDDWREAEAQIDGMLAAMAATGVGREEYERQGIRNALRLWRS